MELREVLSLTATATERLVGKLIAIKSDLGVEGVTTDDRNEK